jgi:hypothetical protein
VCASAFINLVKTNRFSTQCRLSSSEVASIDVDFSNPVPLIVERRIDVVTYPISPANVSGEAAAPADEVANPMTRNDDTWLLNF